MSTKTIEAGRAFLRLMVQDEQFRKGLDRSIAKLDKFGQDAIVLGAKIGAVGTALAAPFALAVKKFAELGAELDDISARTGASVERLSELKFAAEQSGAGVKEVEAAYKRMSKAIGAADRGVKSSVAAFESLGISVEELIGLHPDQQFNRIAWAINGVADPTKKAELSMKLLGSTAMIPLIRDMDELSEKARDTGRVMTTEMATAAAELDDAMAALKSSVEAAVMQVGAALAPAITKAATALDDAMPSIIEWVKQNGDVVVLAAEVGVALQALGLVISSVGTAYRAAAASAALFQKAAILNKLPAPVKIAGGAALAGGVAAEIIGRAFPAEQLSTAEQIERTQKYIVEDKEAIARFTARQGEMEQMALQSAQKALAVHQKELAILKERLALERAAPIPVVNPRTPAFEDNTRPLPVVHPAPPSSELAALREQAQQEQERLRDQQQRELERRASEVASLRDNIMSQVESASRGGRGTFGGKLAHQIFGTSRADDTERRMLRVEEKMEEHLKNVVALLRQAKPLMVTNQ